MTHAMHKAILRLARPRRRGTWHRPPGQVVRPIPPALGPLPPPLPDASPTPIWRVPRAGRPEVETPIFEPEGQDQFARPTASDLARADTRGFGYGRRRPDQTYEDWLQELLLSLRGAQTDGG